MIAVYVSGHGFGHATRTGEVLGWLRVADPGLPIAVSSSAPEAHFRSAISGPFQFRTLECDVGLVQPDALTIDLPNSYLRCRKFDEAFPSLVASEARWLREAGAGVVLGDIPPLASAAAHEAGVESVSLGNFSWDWIYRYLGQKESGLLRSADLAAAAYAKTDLLLELPFAGDFQVFPRRQKIPLIARRPQVGREETRTRLGIGSGSLALWSFGGMGLPGFRRERLPRTDAIRFVEVADRASTDSMMAIAPSRLRQLSLSYVDLVGACDAVVTKPGYGIVSDAIGAGTRILYTDRGDFPEYPILVREMGTLLPCQYVAQGDLLAGRILEALRALMAQPMPPPPDVSGAEVAAKTIRGLLH